MYIAPRLLEMSGSLVDPAWRTLDVLEHTEEAIHGVMQAQHSGARPPRLLATRPEEGLVVLEYSSARRLCSLAKGIARGMASHYGERITLAEPLCMHRGDPICRIEARRG